MPASAPRPIPRSAPTATVTKHDVSTILTSVAALIALPLFAIGSLVAIGVRFYEPPERNIEEARVVLGSIAVANGDPANQAEGLRLLRESAATGNARGLNAYAWVLATHPQANVRNGAEAVTWAKRAVGANPSPGVRDTLAAAYAEVGDWDHALEQQRRAVREAHANKSYGNATSLEEHLASFERHQPIRDTRLRQ